MKLNPAQFEPQRERLFDPEPYAGIGARAEEVIDQYREDDGSIVDERFTGRLLHRSDREFEPGQPVLPAVMHRGGQRFGISSAQHAYAYREARSTVMGTAGETRVEPTLDDQPGPYLGKYMYEVEPITQDFSDDPNWASAHSIRSNKGFVVKRRIEEPA